MAPDEGKPADPDKGFPNPHADHFDGERTPAEQHEYEQQQAARDAAARESTRSDDAGSSEGVPTNPTGTPRSAY